MEEKTVTAAVPKKKKHKSSRTLTIIFYTVYALLILSFLAGLYFVNGHLEAQLSAYEISHISVASQDIFSQLFSDPDWGGLYRLARLEDSHFENEDDFVDYITAKTAGQTLSYCSIPADSTDSHSYEVKLQDEVIGSFTLTDSRDPGDQWPFWKLTDFTLDLPREHSLQIWKRDDCTVYIGDVALTEEYTLRIDTTIAEAYLPAGTDGDSMHLQQITGLLNSPDIRVLAPDGTECDLIQDPETGIYIQQLPETEPVTASEQALILKTAEVYSMFKLKAATAGYLGLYFQSTEQAYRDILSGEYWIDTPSGCQVTDQKLLDFCRVNEDLYYARVTHTASTVITECDYILDATFFFIRKSGSWTCFQVAQGDTRIPISRVRLDFLVDGQAVFYDFFYEGLTRIRVPLVTAPEGYTFSGWAAEDGSLLLIPDEEGYAAIPEGTLLVPTALNAVFEEIEGGN